MKTFQKKCSGYRYDVLELLGSITKAGVARCSFYHPPAGFSSGRHPQSYIKQRSYKLTEFFVLLARR